VIRINQSYFLGTVPCRDTSGVPVFHPTSAARSVFSRLRSWLASFWSRHVSADCSHHPVTCDCEMCANSEWFMDGGTRDQTYPRGGIVWHAEAGALCRDCWLPLAKCRCLSGE
jgi:hypothetical protein